MLRREGPDRSLLDATALEALLDQQLGQVLTAATIAGKENPAAGRSLDAKHLGYFGSSIVRVPCANFDEAFRRTESGETDFSVVPVENSTEGTISRVLDLLLNSPLKVCAEVVVRVQQNLMRKREGRDGITKVYSHGQSLAQTQNWLNRNLPGVDRVTIRGIGRLTTLLGTDQGVAVYDDGFYVGTVAGLGSSTHLAMELLKAETGMQIENVPYKGSALLQQDLLAGRIPVAMDSISIHLQHIRSGAVRALGVTSPTRAPDLPDVPTIAEAAVPGYDAVVWLYVAAPAKTPPEVVTRLNDTILKIIRTPDMEASGVTIILTTHYIEEAEEMADRIGVISKGELILVEDKAALMQKLGKKQLILHLQTPLAALPPGLAGEPLELAEDGQALIYTFDVQAADTGIAGLLRRHDRAAGKADQ